VTAPSDRISVRLILLFLLLRIVNQIDRQVVADFAHNIICDLYLWWSQFALIAGLVFSWIYAFTSSAAGLLAGLAQDFWTMLAARLLVAVGDLTYGTSGQSACSHALGARKLIQCQ
jgi:hypothetical protein